jgi:hypothetical protein
MEARTAAYVSSYSCISWCATRRRPSATLLARTAVYTCPQCATLASLGAQHAAGLQPLYLGGERAPPPGLRPAGKCLLLLPPTLREPALIP